MKYSDIVLKNAKNPKNIGRMKKPDLIGTGGNPVCGDTLELQLKLKGDKIVDVKFQTLGCGVAIAVASIFTEMIKGKTLEEAKKIGSKDIVKALGGLPNVKVHCSMLAVEALKDALKKYKKEK